MRTAIVTITGEWFFDAAEGLRRVERGTMPECLVDDVPVLVLWSAMTDLSPELALRTFRERTGPRSLVVVDGPRANQGWLEASTPHVGQEREVAFIAAAVVKFSWGWDESEFIRVQDASGSLAIAVEFDPHHAHFLARLIP